MKWQMVLEVQLTGSSADIEELLDQVMLDLLAAGVANPGIGISGSDPGLAEIEFVVDAPPVLHEAHDLAQEILGKSALRASRKVARSLGRARVRPIQPWSDCPSSQLTRLERPRGWRAP